MDASINKIYDMMYSPIITPYNIVENAKLDNYTYVKYYKSGNEFIAEMECEIAEEGFKIFYYHFNENDFLQRIFMRQGETIEKVFDRANEIEKAKELYYEAKPEYCKVV